MTRRARQLAEIAALAATGHTQRAEGLSCEHLADFPEDDAVLAGLLAHPIRAHEGDAR